MRDLTFGGRERAEHAAYPQMWPLTTAIPRDPAHILSKAKTFMINLLQNIAPMFIHWRGDQVFGFHLLAQEILCVF